MQNTHDKGTPTTHKRKTKMKKKIFTFATIIVLIICALPIQSAKAYSTLPFHINIAVSFVPYSGLTADTISHMGLAAKQWNSAAGKTIMYVSLNRHSSMSYPTKNGVNEVYKRNAGAAGYVGQTTSWYTSGVLTESDTNFNMYYSFANSQQLGCYDTYSIFLHEAGHTAGMGHSAYSSAVMWPTAYTNTLRRTLQADDKNGIASKY